MCTLDIFVSKQTKRRRRWEQFHARQAESDNWECVLIMCLQRYRGYIMTLRLIVAKSPTCHSCTVVRIDGTPYARQVMFLRTEHAKAIQCYRDVLKHKPNNYKALQKLIDLLRRGGTLDEVTELDAIHLLVLRSASTSRVHLVLPYLHHVNMDDVAHFPVSSWFRYGVALNTTLPTWPRLGRKHAVCDAVLAVYKPLHYLLHNLREGEGDEVHVQLYFRQMYAVPICRVTTVCHNEHE